jgi:hypothetical protein
LSLPYHQAKYVPPAYSSIASEGFKVKGEKVEEEEVEESKGVQGCYLTLADQKSSMQMNLIFL